MTVLVVVAEVPWRDRIPAAAAIFDELLTRVDVNLAAVEHLSLLDPAPPSNRDPRPDELDDGADRVFAQITNIEPQVLAPLGSLPTRLLTGREAGITTLRGRPQPAVFALVAYWVLPLFPPTWAVRTKSMRDALRADVDQLPDLLARDRPVFEVADDEEEEHQQLGLFGRTAPMGVDA